MKPVTLRMHFNFACNSTVSCFNQCCRDLNQFLTPYGVIRLKRRMGMTSTQFLKTYTVQHQGPRSGFPIVTYKMNSDLRCPFVSDEGCRVYEDRPSSCRSYPLIRLAARSRETGEISEKYFLIQEEHCLGFEERQEQTVEDWIKHQGLDRYNRMNDMLMELISLKNRLLPDPFDAETKQRIYTALYDLDEFKNQVACGKISLSIGNVDGSGDEDILKLSIQWVKTVIMATTNRNH